MQKTPESARFRDPLIEAAVRPLADNAELHLAAAGFLENLKTSDDGAREAVSRWDALDASSHRPVWKLALCLVLALVSALVWIADAGDLFRHYQWVKWALNPYAGPFPDSTERVSSRLGAAQRLLVFGDLEKEAAYERKEGLWRSEPGNPEYFAEYAAASLSYFNELPADYWSVVEGLDPENAWFVYLAASAEAKGAVRQNDVKRGKVVDGASPGWEVLDEARLESSLKLLHSGRALKKCENHAAALLRKRLAVLPHDNLVDGLDSVGVLAASTSFSGIRAFHLVSVINARAWQMGESADVDGFLELEKDTEAFLRGLFGIEPTTMLEQVIHTGFVKVIAGEFVPAAVKLGLAGSAARWRQIGERIQAQRDAGKARDIMLDGRKVDLRAVSGLFSGGSLEAVPRLVKSPPVLKDADLKPGRMIDHEILSRFFGHAIWLLMGLCLGLVAVYRFRVPVMVRCLARRTEGLMRTVDWAWILGAGVVLPFVCVMAINRLSPLGGRDFGMLGNSLLLPAGHFLGLLALWLIVPVALIRWRLAKRAGCFGFRKPPWPVGLAVLAAAAFVPVIGWVAIAGSPGGFWVEWMGELGFEPVRNSATSASIRWAAGLLAVPLLWLLVAPGLAVFGSSRRAFQRTVISLILVRPYALAMLLIILATPAFKAAEQSWFERDTLMKTDASTPSWSRYEYLVAAQMRTEVREILGFER